MVLHVQAYEHEEAGSVVDFLQHVRKNTRTIPQLLSQVDWKHLALAVLDQLWCLAHIVPIALVLRRENRSGFERTCRL
jgi:hypothetical protein